MDALLFVPVAIAISLTPGSNNFCGLNNGIRAGVGPALIATVGRAAAFAIFLTVSAVGLGAMLLASEAAFTAVKWVGAAYLFWLGWKAWHSREFSGLALDDAPGGAPASGQPAQFSLRALIAQEFLLGITNPKAIILLRRSFRSSSTPRSLQRANFWCSAPSIWAANSCRPLCTPASGARSAASSAPRAAWPG